MDRAFVVAAGAGPDAAAAIRQAFALGYGAVLAGVPLAAVALDETAPALGWLEREVLAAVERSSRRPEVRLLCPPEHPQLATDVRPFVRLLAELGVACRLETTMSLAQWIAEQLGDAELTPERMPSPRTAGRR